HDEATTPGHPARPGGHRHAATPSTRDLLKHALSELAGVARTELAKLHGMGPKALEIIQSALEEHNLSLG
ncbi:hypothetical protein, partial [Micromonospora sp. NPDC005305]|uniref:hypothetical protein n=1 Tax=Micromonospora sp. NPDC005305 TaxID=3156875 RepID=UPI0033B43784